MLPCQPPPQLARIHSCKKEASSSVSQCLCTSSLDSRLVAQCPYKWCMSSRHQTLPVKNLSGVPSTHIVSKTNTIQVRRGTNMIHRGSRASLIDLCIHVSHTSPQKYLHATENSP